MKLQALLALILSLSADSALVDLRLKKTRTTSFDSSSVFEMDGKVLAVSETAITVQPIVPRGAVKTVPFHDFLAAGKVHHKVSDHNSYRSQDLKVGDLVTLDMFSENKIEFAVAICIYERPGDIVPPGKVLKVKYPHHERMNARIAFRDKGTPIPEHLIVK